MAVPVWTWILAVPLTTLLMPVSANKPSGARSSSHSSPVFACLGVGGDCDYGERLAFGALDGPRFACVQDAGRGLIFSNPDRGVIVACEQAQYGKRHVRAAARSASRNYFSTRPATTDGIERQRQIGIVLVWVVALYFKGFGGIDQSTTRVAHRVGIPHIYVAGQASAQQCVEPAVHGDNVVALPR